MIDLARRVTAATGAPVVDGVAVVLHGGGRHTRDIDVFAEDFWATHEKLEAAGIRWDSDRREHLVDGVAVHMVSAEMLGGVPQRISTIEGVKVIGLADLVRAKLTTGLSTVRRSKDLTHIIDLIADIPLDKSFAAKLPRHLRPAFKALVDQIHGPRRTAMPPAKFRKLYA